MMDDLFEKYIKDHGLCSESDRILVAVSGGADSIVLLNLFIRQGYQAGITHCNFGLRGKESDTDESFVRNIAERNRVPFFSERFETEKIADELGISVQMAARELRYSWFEKIRKEQDYDYIATGHNRNDSIETVIFNFIKGTGLKGITGIPRKTGHIIRPLLFAARKEIEEYALENGLDYRDDSSNKSVKYSRNFIRHKILPEFEKINPGFQNTVENTLSRLEGVYNLLQQWMESEKATFMRTHGKDIYLKKEFFIKNKEPVLLFEVLSPFGFNYDQCLEIFQSMKSASGKIFYGGSYVLNSDRSDLILSPLEDGDLSTPINREDRSVNTDRFRLDLEYLPAGQVNIGHDRRTAYLDAEKLEFPLLIRTWQEGDWFVPLGMKGKKKLSDFMIDKKIPLNLKKRIRVLTCGKNIVWVAGHRIDDRYRVGDETQEILKITYLEPDDQTV